MIATSLIGSGGQMSQGHVWNKWVDYILQKKDLSFTKAALVYRSGTIAAHSRQFQLSSRDVKTLHDIFKGENNNYPEKVTFQGLTYITKQDGGNDCYVAFNGNKYVIVCRSNRMILVAMCSSRRKYMDASNWINCLHKKLLQNNY